MDVSTFRRTVPLVASAVLITALTVGAYAAPATAAPDEQKAAARAEAKAAREAAKQARAEARAEAKAAREAAKLDRSVKVTVCHKPGTPAQGTLEISVSALQAHLDHGDTKEACASTVPATSTTCQESSTSDTETSPVTATEEDDTDDISCEEPQPVLVSIDAPEFVDAQDLLQLQGAVSGLEADDLDYVWSSTCLTDEELVDPAIIVSESATALLVIREDTLSPGTTCDFTLTVTDEAETEVGSATVTVEVLALP